MNDELRAITGLVGALLVVADAQPYSMVTTTDSKESVVRSLSSVLLRSDIIKVLRTRVSGSLLGCANLSGESEYTVARVLCPIVQKVWASREY